MRNAYKDKILKKINEFKSIPKLFSMISETLLEFSGTPLVI